MFKTLSPRAFFGRFALAMTALMLALPVSAQMFVEENSFRAYPVTNTMASQKENKRIDNNAKICAIVRIYTIEKNFEFDAGDFGPYGKPEYKTGEVWVWISEEAPYLEISHPEFGKCSYKFPEEIEAGRTYELKLNPGNGRYVNITASGVARAEVIIDGETVGQTPLNNFFLRYGSRRIQARYNRFLADTLFNVPSGSGTMFMDLRMVDQSKFFGKVRLNAERQTDIYVQGKKVATGTWDNELREGSYDIVTKKANCSDAVTTINVKAGQANSFKLREPVPHTGRLQVITKPATRVTALLDGRTPIDFTQPQALPVGPRSILFQRKGYHELEHQVNIIKDKLIVDSVTLEKISFLKSKAFYFGGGYSLGSLPGLEATAGFIWQNHDLSFSYLIGMGASNNVYWYNAAGELQSGLNYKMNGWSIRYGYQLGLLARIGVTPQIGFMQQQLTGSVVEGTGKYGDGAKASILTVGAKIVVAPFNYCYLFVKPEYGLAMSKDEAFEVVADKGDFTVGGFTVSAGVHIIFDLGKKKSKK